MLCPEEMAEEDLLDFILKGDAPAGDLLEKGDSLLEDWGLLQPEVRECLAQGSWQGGEARLKSVSCFMVFCPCRPLETRRWKTSSAAS